MKLPYLTTRVKLGFDSIQTKADCRVISEENYQYVVNLLTDIRSYDIKEKLEGKKMLPQDIRIRIQDFLEAHKKTIL